MGLEQHDSSAGLYEHALTYLPVCSAEGYILQTSFLDHHIIVHIMQACCCMMHT